MLANIILRPIRCSRASYRLCQYFSTVYVSEKTGELSKHVKRVAIEITSRHYFPMIKLFTEQRFSLSRLCSFVVIKSYWGFPESTLFSKQLVNDTQVGKLGRDPIEPWSLDIYLM